MGMSVAVEAAIDAGAGARAAMVWPGSRDGVTGAAPLEAVARGGVDGAAKVVVVAVAEVTKVAEVAVAVAVAVVVAVVVVVVVATPTGCARGNAVTGVANSTWVRPTTVAWRVESTSVMAEEDDPAVVIVAGDVAGDVARSGGGGGGGGDGGDGACKMVSKVGKVSMRCHSPVMMLLHALDLLQQCTR
jgi:hypothetical protein